MISNLVTRVIPRLFNNKKERVLKFIKDEARQGAERDWDGNILEVLPNVANMLEFHLQATIPFHSQLEAILKRTFLDTNPVLTPDSVERYFILSVDINQVILMQNQLCTIS